MTDIFSLIILAIDIVFSIWNSYSAGLSYGMLKRYGGPAWAYVSPIFGFIFGLVGGIYTTMIVVGFVGYAIGIVDSTMVDLLFAYNYLITGGLIVVLGIGVTIQSIYVSSRRPGFWNVSTSIYNTFASAWNVFGYMRDFGPLQSMINSERDSEHKSNLGTVIVLALTAILLGVLISVISFNAGQNASEARDSKRLELEAFAR